RALVVDKTGTLTHGRARIVSINAISDQPADELLRLAASLDQASKHIVAQTIVDGARDKGLELAIPNNIIETPGRRRRLRRWPAGCGRDSREGSTDRCVYPFTRTQDPRHHDARSIDRHRRDVAR